MKKFFSNKYAIAGVIIVIAGAVVYFTTWGNKKWLIDEISDKSGDKTPANLETMNVSQLQKLLKSV